MKKSRYYVVLAMVLVSPHMPIQAGVIMGGVCVFAAALFNYWDE